MAKPGWLSIEEITRLWSAEIGLEASALQQDLEAWFADYVKQFPTSAPLLPGDNTGNTNCLMGTLGARHLERTTFATCCEERGYPKPQFWFGDRGDDTWDDKPKASVPALTRPEAARLQPDAEPSCERDESNPELAAFQSQIADLSKRLETPSIEVPGFSEASQTAQRDLEAEPRQTVRSSRKNPQYLSELAAAASAEARELKARLDAAEQRIADLCAHKETGPIASETQPSSSSSASLQRQRHDATRCDGPDPRGPSGYRDPSATSQLLRTSSGRRQRRWRVALLAGVAVLLGGLFFSMSPQGPALVGLAERFEAESALQSLEQIVTKLGGENEGLRQAGKPRASGSAESPATEQNFVLAQRQATRRSAAVEASSAKVVQLQDELADARQEVEPARQTTSAGAPVETREESPWSQALAAEVEIAGLRAALQQAEEQATQSDSAREAAKAAAAEAYTVLAIVQRELDTLRDQLNAALAEAVDARKNGAGNRAASAGLHEDMARLRADNARLMNELEKSYADLADLRAALKKAELITNLRKVVGAVEN